MKHLAGGPGSVLLYVCFLPQAEPLFPVAPATQAHISLVFWSQSTECFLLNGSSKSSLFESLALITCPNLRQSLGFARSVQCPGWPGLGHTASVEPERGREALYLSLKNEDGYQEREMEKKWGWRWSGPSKENWGTGMKWWDNECEAGRQNICPKIKVSGEWVWGCFARLAMSTNTLLLSVCSMHAWCLGRAEQ